MFRNGGEKLTRYDGEVKGWERICRFCFMRPAKLNRAFRAFPDGKHDKERERPGKVEHLQDLIAWFW